MASIKSLQATVPSGLRLSLNVRVTMKRSAVICILVLSGCSSNSIDVPQIPDWPVALHASGSSGFDGLHCWKVSLTEEGWKKTVASLQLKAMETYPTYDSSPANCKEIWWDVDFPQQSQRYWVSGDGDIRRLALYQGGFLYITNEYR